MTSTVLDVWNQALSAANGKGRVTDENEASREREICSLHYDLARDCVQESAYWPICRSIENLALLVTASGASQWAAGQPLPGYQYTYALPTNYLRAWSMTDFSFFEIGYDATLDRLVIYSNTPNATLMYAARNTTVNSWSPGQKQATIFGLAGYIATSLVGGNDGLSQRLWQKANIYLAEGASYGANEPVATFDTIPDWLAARGNLPAVSPIKFYYPRSTGFGTGVVTNG